jgi:uncharacterized cupredoxin-like copper-binding protein
MKRLMIIGPIAALAATGCGGGSSHNTASAPATTTKTETQTTASSGIEKDPVTLDDFAIRPATTTLQPGKIEFKVKNTGKQAHEFVVIDTGKPAAKLGKGAKVPEKGNIGETGNLQPGQAKTLVLNLRKGHYAVICNDPGHYMAGMHRDLNVA